MLIGSVGTVVLRCNCCPRTNHVERHWSPQQQIQFPKYLCSYIKDFFHSVQFRRQIRGTIGFLKAPVEVFNFFFLRLFCWSPPNDLSLCHEDPNAKIYVEAHCQHRRLSATFFGHPLVFAAICWSPKGGAIDKGETTNTWDTDTTLSISTSVAFDICRSRVTNASTEQRRHHQSSN
jgi:hypothetical protein